MCFYFLWYESNTDLECLFLHTLYFIDGYVIQGRRKLSMNFFLMWIDSMLERTRHLIQHSITGSIFLEKNCHPSFALCNTLVISLEAKSSALCVQSFTLLMGVLKLLSNLYAQEVIYYPHATNSFWYCFTKTCNGITFKQFILDKIVIGMDN